MAKLITDETHAAYAARFKRMVAKGFTEDGNHEFVRCCSAKSEQVDNLHVRASINGWTIENDEPRDLGGENLAPTPMELLLASLANCLEISALLYFSFAKMDVASVRVTVNGTFDQRAIVDPGSAPFPGFSSIECTWEIESAEPVEKIGRVLEKVDQNCPVRGSFTNGTTFTRKVRLVGPEKAGH